MEFAGCSVLVLSAQKPRFFQVFSHFGEVPLAVCSAHAGSVHGGMRRCVSRRAAQIESFFASRESSKHWGLACSGLIPIHASGGSRIRTVRAIS